MCSRADHVEAPRAPRTVRAIFEPTIIASNSSYFVPSMLTRFVSQPQRFAHLHFHSPVWRATIVDIVPGPETDPAIVSRLHDFASAIGQTPIVQSVEKPGYIFNWLLQATLKASLELVDRRVASPENIDLAWTRITGMERGPFGMMDLIGIDLIHQVLSNARWLGDYDGTSASSIFCNHTLTVAISVSRRVKASLNITPTAKVVRRAADRSLPTTEPSIKSC